MAKKKEEVVENSKNRLEVLQKFTDRFDDSIHYSIGDIITIDDVKRVNDLISRGLVKNYDL